MRSFAAFAVFVAAAACAHAQDPAAGYTSRTIRIFGQGTGSTADYLSRYIALKLTERWGQPVIVDSRAGAGGTIPTDVVAKSPPDGYNLVMGHIGPMVSAVTLYAKSLPYDPIRDFEPVTMVAQGVVVLVTHPSVPVASATEFPSAAEAGIPGMEVKLWFGLFAPAKTPRAIVAKLNREIGDILRAPETQETLLKQGVAAAPGSPEELGDWVKSELARWTPIIQAAGIKAD